jgi:type II secretion system protein E
VGILARNPNLDRILEEADMVSEESISKVLQHQDEAAESVETLLMPKQEMSEADVTAAFAERFDMKVASIHDYEIDQSLLHEIPVRFCKQLGIFPLKFENGTLTVAISDPMNLNVTDDLRLLGAWDKVESVIVKEHEIEAAIKRYYEGTEVEGMLEELTEEAHEEVANLQDSELDDEELAEEAPIIRLVNKIFELAVKNRASDIHIEPFEKVLRVRLRIDGVCQELPSPPKFAQGAILSRLKILSGMDLSEKRVPQDGRIKLQLMDKDLDLRVSALPALYGESMVMRILDKASVLIGLEDIGFLPDMTEDFGRLIKSPNGVILVTGPTGSGKTTTLYSALSTINTIDKKIITIENPVEYQLDGINQVQVNTDSGLTFAKGLRTMLRQSPDVIMVGEIRDRETAEIAIRAALTGHLVFSTLHTNDASGAVSRLIDMGIKPFLVASSVQAIMAQRLVRTICPGCRTETDLDIEVIRSMGIPITDEEHADITFYKGRGCDKCGQSGYRGRTSILEMLHMNNTIRTMTLKSEATSRIKTAAIKAGMRTLRMDGWEKVKRGDTTIEEVARVTQEDD